MNAPRNVPNNRTIIFNRARMMPDRFMDEKYRAGRENHTQKKYAPLAIAASLVTHNRLRPPMARVHETADTMGLRSHSTLRLNRSNVKRKAAARGRMRSP